MNVRLYYNTGFNAVNIPDTPDLLNTSAFTFADFPALDVLQERFLSDLKIRATWGQVKNADYLRITDGNDSFYYIITAVKMTSVDVANLAIVADFVTSAGGLENLTILDGIATRAHVSTDNYGEWVLDDDYLLPSEPLLLDTHTINFSNATVDIVESSVDLGCMANVSSAETYLDVDEESVTVPKVFSSMGDTQYTMDGKTATSTKTMLFPLSDATIRAGIEQCRALGIESVITNTVNIPGALVTLTAETETIAKVTISGVEWLRTTLGNLQRTFHGNYTGEDGAGGVSSSWGAYTVAAGAFSVNDTGFAFEYATVKNKRVLYGALNKHGLLTTAGNRLESNPEKLTGGNRTSVHIKSVGDPHTNGAPYHRFEYMDGNASNTAFWLNAVKGLQWRQIPLMYSQKSGGALDRIALENSRRVADYNFGQSTMGKLHNVFNKFGLSDIGETAVGMGGATLGAFGGLGGASAAASALTSVGAGAAAVAAIPAAIIAAGAAGAAYGAMDKYNNAVETYQMQKQIELQQFAIGQNVVAPQISVSYDGEAYRDFYGETVIAYRYRPKTNDLARMDKILTMYGYRVAIPATDADLHNRQYFNYVEAVITVGGGLPKWMCDGIAAQVSNGVRLWHVKPNNTYYAENPIVQNGGGE